MRCFFCPGRRSVSPERRGALEIVAARRMGREKTLWFSFGLLLSQGYPEGGRWREGERKETTKLNDVRRSPAKNAKGKKILSFFLSFPPKRYDVF